MTVLTYRGKNYPQKTKFAPKQLVELSYRSNIYNTRQADAKKQVQLTIQVHLTYRGTKYQKQLNIV